MRGLLGQAAWGWRSRATRWLSREMRRDALLRCRTPLLTAFVSVFTAKRSFSSAAGRSPRAMVSRSSRNTCLIRVRTALLRAARFNDWRWRLMADL